MNNKKAFVDTTILTDRLLKPNGKGKVAKEALGKYAKTELPVYAIKEFKAGPLSNFKWMHNKLAITGSFAKSLDALQKMSLTPKRYTTSTALEALKESAEIVGRKITAEKLVEKYGAKAKFDVMQCDIYRLSIKTAIIKAWKLRRNVTTDVVQPLNCYQEKAPFEERGLLNLDPIKCKPEHECCLAPELRKNINKLIVLKETIKKLSEKTENTTRHKILREISRKPKQLISETYCRALGDAYFALFCPQDAIILTTNIKDHKPLAESLGKNAEVPE